MAGWTCSSPTINAQLMNIPHRVMLTQALSGSGIFERYSQGVDNDIDGDEEAWDLVEIIKRSEIALGQFFLLQMERH